MADWMPSIPRNPNTAILNPANPLQADGCVTHRTIGHWAGDLSVLTATRVPSCHFLVGEAHGQWTQMVPINVIANHAAGANEWAVGIEVSGQNGSPFTQWQLEAIPSIINWLATVGIPKNRYRGNQRVSHFKGYIDHAFIATTPALQHFDYWNPADWDTVAGTPQGDIEMDAQDKKVMAAIDGHIVQLIQILQKTLEDPNLGLVATNVSQATSVASIDKKTT